MRKILLIGDFDGRPDEGMRSVSQVTAYRLSKKHDIYKLNPKRVINPIEMLKIIRFKPDLIHYLTGPTIRSLLILKIFRLITPNAIQLISLIRPFFSSFQTKLLKYLIPDLVLVQDPNWEKYFNNAGWRTRFFPNGVDCDLFLPVDYDEKLRLRQKYGFPVDKKLALHVGHIRQNRNLVIIEQLQSTELFQCVLIASSAFNPDETTKDMLLESGCMIIEGYNKNIQEVFACVDLYVFPVLPSLDGLPIKYNQVGVIDFPLSVIEALACNLPVVSTQFPALTRIIKPGAGLEWFDGTLDDCISSIKKIDQCEIDTRSKVLPLNWDHLIDQLEDIYSKLLCE